MEKTVFVQLAERFPQMMLAPAPGRSQTAVWRGAALRGQPVEGGALSHFIGSNEDRLWTEPTPAGEVQVLFLKHRGDFECCYQILACRCEPKALPATMGAVTLDGLNDWGAIHTHMAAYAAAGHRDANAEFRRFTADPGNYKATLVLLSDGPYSAVPAAETPWDEPEWLRLSLSIRLYHELTHVVCRRRWPDQKHAVFDELLADCMGLDFALGRYDPALARRFLGLDAAGRYLGGRLENYLRPEEKADALAARVNALLEELAARCAASSAHGWPLLMELEPQAPVLIERFLAPEAELQLS